MWIYFLSLLLAAGMTLALLPACGGGGGGDSCNSFEPESEEGEGACEDEEVNEEIIADEDEIGHEEEEVSDEEDEAEDSHEHEFREETGQFDEQF